MKIYNEQEVQCPTFGVLLSLSQFLSIRHIVPEEQIITRVLPDHIFEMSNDKITSSASNIAASIAYEGV